MTRRAIRSAAGLCLSLLLLGPPAGAEQAEPPCDGLRQLLVEAPADFKGIDGGATERKDGSRRTKVALPGALGCGIQRVKGGRGVYWCEWESTTETSDRRMTALANSIGQCIGAFPDRQQDALHVVKDGVRFTVDGGETMGDLGFELRVSAE